MREINEGVLTHPLVAHFWEEHGGRRQDVREMKLSSHLTPQEHQVQESGNIIKAMANQEECLNNKSEWGV